MAAVEKDQAWSAEDDARVLALLDDGTKASIATMFMGREENEVITMDQLMEMMSEIQVAYDPDMISKIVPEEEWDSLTLHQCNVIIGRFIEMAQRHVAEQAKAESTVLVTQSATPIVYLNTFQYLWHLMPCSSKEEGVEYRWTKIKFDVRPKTILMASVATMMVVSGITLIAVIIALNERIAANERQDTLKVQGSTTGTTGHVLLESGVRSVAAQSLQDSSDVVARIAESFLLARQDLVMSELAGTLHFVETLITEQAENRWLQQRSVLLEKAKSLPILFRTQGTVQGLKRLTEHWHADEMITSYAFDSTNSTVFTNGCADTTGLSGCLANASAGQVTAGESTVCGKVVQWVSAPVPRISISVCLTRDRSHIEEAVLEEVGSIATSMNNAVPSTTIEMQVAGVKNGQIMPLGSRKSLPTLCVRSGDCAEDMPLFTRALNSETPGSATVSGYNSVSWLAAYSKVDVMGSRVLLGLKQDVTEDKRAFYETLVSNAPTINASGMSITFAVGNSLEEVELLPLNTSTPTASQDRFFGFALHGRTGVSFADLGQDNSVMAGYAAAVNAELAVGVQLPSETVSEVATSLLIRILQEQSRTLPDDQDILVVSQSGSSYNFLTTPKNACPRKCRAHGAAVEGFRTRSSGIDDFEDHTGEEVVAWYQYYAQDPPIVVIVQRRHKDARDTIFERRLIAIGVGCIIIVAVQLVILILTRRVLDRIENDYNKYKRHIEEEKHQFSELVKDVMPPYIAERIMKGTRLIAETHPQLTFFFSDIVGSTETSKTLTNKQLVRMLGYTFMLEDEIASHHGVHKIKTIGDAYFAVVGLEDSTGGAASGKDHQVYRMVSFACVCQQLFGPTYSHYPERTECFRISAHGQDMGEMKMVRMRMGIHTGPAVAGVVDVGRAPHFDCFGPSVNLASRMESTSTAGRVQISGPTMEILSKLDKEGLFEFDPPRKTLVKGYGTMVTYLIKSTNLHVPESLISKLHIERAKRRQYFSGDRANGRPSRRGGGSTPSQRDDSSKQSTPRAASEPEPQPEPKRSPQEQGIASLLPDIWKGDQAPRPGALPNEPKKESSKPPKKSSKEPKQSSSSASHQRTAAPQIASSTPAEQPPPPPQFELPGFGGVGLALPPPPPPPDF